MIAAGLGQGCSEWSRRTPPRPCVAVAVMPPSRRPHPPRAFHSVKVTPPIPRLPPRQHRTHSSRHSDFAAARPRAVDERCYIIRRGGGSEYVSRASVPPSDFEAEGRATRGGPVCIASGGKKLPVPQKLHRNRLLSVLPAPPPPAASTKYQPS